MCFSFCPHPPSIESLVLPLARPSYLCTSEPGGGILYQTQSHTQRPAIRTWLALVYKFTNVIRINHALLQQKNVRWNCIHTCKMNVYYLIYCGIIWICMGQLSLYQKLLTHFVDLPVEIIVKTICFTICWKVNLQERGT